MNLYLLAVSDIPSSLLITHICCSATTAGKKFSIGDRNETKFSELRTAYSCGNLLFKHTIDASNGVVSGWGIQRDLGGDVQAAWNKCDALRAKHLSYKTFSGAVRAIIKDAASNTFIQRNVIGR